MHVAFATDVGREREHNEDTGLVRSFPGGHLLIVCDGMGGHAAGDVASQEACTAILEVLAGSINSGRADEDPAGTLLRALTVANNQVLARAEEIGQRSMGTTAVVALVLDKMAWVGWVGDSRLYHLREGRVEHRTEDHTRVQEMVRHGILTPDQAESHPDGHILTMAIGGGSGAQAHFKPSVWSEPIALGDEDVLLLCSDGLHDLLADDEMSEIMGGQPADWAVRALIDEANSRGGHDNISVALLSVSPMIPNVPVPEPTYVEPIAEPDSEPPSVLTALRRNLQKPQPEAVKGPQRLGWISLAFGFVFGIGLGAYAGMPEGAEAEAEVVEPEVEPVVVAEEQAPPIVEAETPPIAELDPAPPEEPVAPGGTVCPSKAQWPAGMVCIEGGSFQRRAIQSTCRTSSSAYVETEAVLLDTFFIDSGEVRNIDWKACAEAGSCGGLDRDGPAWTSDEQPKVSVTWDEAGAFCEAQGKRLVTETEWDRALWGQSGGLAPLDPGVATCADATFKGCSGATTVRGKTLDRDGLTDMVANAPEWVADRYTADLAACGEPCAGENPQGPVEGSKRVVKGGSYTAGAECAFGEQRRGKDPANPKYNNFGFRCAVSLKDVGGVVDFVAPDGG